MSINIRTCALKIVIYTAKFIIGLQLAAVRAEVGVVRGSLETGNKQTLELLQNGDDDVAELTQKYAIISLSR